jgi:5'-3' exonuclease
MGVPAFFRWLSRKYPSVIIECVEKKVKIWFVYFPLAKMLELWHFSVFLF